MNQPCSKSSFPHEPLLSWACHLGVVKVAGWCSPHRNIKTTWTHPTQQEWLHHQHQDGFPGVSPIPCALVAPVQVVVEAMGNWTLNSIEGSSVCTHPLGCRADNCSRVRTWQAHSSTCPQCSVNTNSVCPCTVLFSISPWICYLLIIFRLHWKFF